MAQMKKNLILGPPGTGKTTKLLSLMEFALEAGYEPEEIAFVSFTKAAVTEATQRAMAKFGLPAKRLRFFRTLHSLAYSALGVARESVLTDYAPFAEAYGFSLSQRLEEGSPPAALKGDDLLLRAKGLCAATGLGIERVQAAYGLPISLLRYETFNERLAEWKRANEKVEFEDLIEGFIAADTPLGVRIAFIDESQDLTPVQWKMADIAFRGVEQLYVCGDDDQCLYSWAGANINRLLTMAGTREVLQQSFRVPHAIFAIAQRIISRITERQPKEWRARDFPGSVSQARIGSLALSAGSWLLLARTNMTLAAYQREVEARGLLYRLNGVETIPEPQVRAYRTLLLLRKGEAVSATDARRLLALTERLPGIRVNKALVRASDFPSGVLGEDTLMLSRIPAQRLRLLRRCPDLSAPIRVEISTIHCAKGKEADHVALSPDLTVATAKALASINHASAEHRAFYVGVTRAKESLSFLRPDADFTYPLCVSA